MSVRRATLVVSLSALVLLLCVSPALTEPLATEAALRKIASKAASGDYAVALASGTARRPRRLYVRVSAEPSQEVDGAWSMVCSRGFGAGSKSGSFSARTPVRRTLRKPMNRPDDCTVSASAQLSRSGRVRVTLLYSR
jgi:hypothetical protein